MTRFLSCLHESPDEKCQYCMIKKWYQVAECLETVIHKLESKYLDKPPMK